MLSCYEISERGSDIIDGNLGLGLRCRVSIHLYGCPQCKVYISRLRQATRIVQALPVSKTAVNSQSTNNEVEDLQGDSI